MSERNTLRSLALAPAVNQFVILFFRTENPTVVNSPRVRATWGMRVPDASLLSLQGLG
jgi:hypothetical protein